MFYFLCDLYLEESRKKSRIESTLYYQNYYAISFYIKKKVRVLIGTLQFLIKSFIKFRFGLNKKTKIKKVHRNMTVKQIMD